MKSFHEIAVDPSAIKSWRDFQLVWAKMGFGAGRLIPNYPSKGPDKETKDQAWVWRVLESIRVHDKNGLKRAQELMIQEKKLKMLSANRQYNHQDSWMVNAMIQQNDNPFSAVISEENNAGNHVCSLDDLGTNNCPECLNDDQHVIELPKNKEAFADAVFPMLKCSSAVKFIDPYYLKKNTRMGTLEFSLGHAKVVQEIAKRMQNINRVPRSVEFHMLTQGFGFEDEIQKFVQEMKAHLPQSWHAKAYLWEEKIAGKRFHSRYILTDVGGIGSEYGIDQGRRNKDDYTDLYLLPEKIRSQRWGDFSPTQEVFTLATESPNFEGIR
jgi:hypothetical protein